MIQRIFSPDNTWDSFVKEELRSTVARGRAGFLAYGGDLDVVLR
jgi:hypothetical protein